MEATPVFDTCLNCQTVFEGKYCNRCGQKAQHRRLPIKALLHDVMHDVFHFENKIFPTLWKLITKPGFLTKEYLEGRRARWFPPFRLFLVMSGLSIFVISPLYQDLCEGLCEGFAPKYHEVDAEKVSPKIQSTTLDKNHPNSESKKENPPKGDQSNLSKNSDAAVNKAVSYTTKAPFFLMPAFAALLYLFDPRKNKLFFDNLILSMHHHAFSSIIFALALPAEQLFKEDSFFNFLCALYLIPIAYLAVSMRVVTSQGWIVSIFKSTLISLIYLFFIFATLMIFLGVSLVLMR